MFLHDMIVERDGARPVLQLEELVGTRHFGILAGRKDEAESQQEGCAAHGLELNLETAEASGRGVPGTTDPLQVFDIGNPVSDERAIIWIGGWASDVSCWDDAMSRALAGFRPRYLSAHAFLRDTAPLGAMLEASARDTVLAGWSLGSLLVEDLLRRGLVPRDMCVVRVCPFLDFCDPSGPWRPLVLRRMARRLQGDAHGVLEEFAERASIPGGEAFRSWIEQATSLGEESLVEGLATLETMRFGAPWSQAPGGFLLSPDDAVSPPCDVPLDRAIVLPAGSGHVPFLHHPEAFSSALRELVE